MRYETMEKEEQKRQEKMAHLKPGWNTNPSNAMQYDSHQPEETRVEMESFHKKVMAQRESDYAKGECNVSSIMYPSMCKISASELATAKAEEARQKQIDDWNKAVAMADERQAGE